MSDDLATLPGLLDAVWLRMAEGALTGRGPGGLLAFSSMGVRGADVRMLVLRSADRAAGLLTFHTNALSGKVADLKRDPRAQVLLWDADAQLQARLSVTVSVHPGPETAWKSLGPGSRLNYARTPDPATPLPDPEAARPVPDAALFTELRASVRQIDVLCLATSPHRRAVFGDGPPRWVAP